MIKTISKFERLYLNVFQCIVVTVGDGGLNVSDTCFSVSSSLSVMVVSRRNLCTIRSSSRTPTLVQVQKLKYKNRETHGQHEQEFRNSGIQTFPNFIHNIVAPILTLCDFAESLCISHFQDYNFLYFYTFVTCFFFRILFRR